MLVRESLQVLGDELRLTDTREADESSPKLASTFAELRGDPEQAAGLRKDIRSYKRVKVRQRCSIAQSGVSARIASVGRCIRPGLCSKGTKIQLCVRPCAGASEGPWLHQAAALCWRRWWCREGLCAAALGASAVGMPWPGQGRTLGGDPRQHTHPRLDSRKSSASRRRPCAGEPAEDVACPARDFALLPAYLGGLGLAQAVRTAPAA